MILGKELNFLSGIHVRKRRSPNDPRCQNSILKQMCASVHTKKLMFLNFEIADRLKATHALEIQNGSEFFCCILPQLPQDNDFWFLGRAWIPPRARKRSFAPRLCCGFSTRDTSEILLKETWNGIRYASVVLS